MEGDFFLQSTFQFIVYFLKDYFGVHVTHKTTFPSPLAFISPIMHEKHEQNNVKTYSGSYNITTNNPVGHKAVNTHLKLNEI